MACLVSEKMRKREKKKKKITVLKNPFPLSDKISDVMIQETRKREEKTLFFTP